jgi:1,3-propanediol dehydrogenase
MLMSDPGPFRNYILQAPIFVETKVPIVLVPTTSGTGSECTTVAIVSLPDLNVKWSVFVSPTLAIVDPELTLTLPKSITASTGMDAFAHAAEAITNVNCNPHSDLNAAAAIEKITKNLLICCETPDNIDARSEMALAANMAGIAFSITICHVGHAVADAFLCHFHTPHGYNCALAVPETMALVAPAMPDRMRMIANAMSFPLIGNETGEQLGKIVADGIRDIMRQAGIKSLSEMGFAREKVISFVPDVLANHLSTFCPVTIDEKTAANLLAAVYDTY